MSTPSSWAELTLGWLQHTIHHKMWEQCSESEEMRETNIMSVLLHQTLNHPSLFFIHEYYIARDWLPDHYTDEWEQAIWWQWEGYHDSLPLSNPHFRVGLPRVQCVSVSVCAAVCTQLCLNVCVSTVEKRHEIPPLPICRGCAAKAPSRNTISGVALALQRAGRQRRRLCEVSTQRERTRDRLLPTPSWPPFLELTAHTGVGLRWATEEETWQAGRTEEEVWKGSWAAEREGMREEMEERR